MHTRYLCSSCLREVSLWTKRLDGPFKELLHMLDVMHQWNFNISNSGQMTIHAPANQILDDQIVHRFTKIRILKATLIDYSSDLIKCNPRGIITWLWELLQQKYRNAYLVLHFYSLQNTIIHVPKDVTWGSPRVLNSAMQCSVMAAGSAFMHNITCGVTYSTVHTSISHPQSYITN